GCDGASDSAGGMVGAANGWKTVGSGAAGGGRGTTGGESTVRCESVCCSASTRSLTLVDVTAFVCVRGPSSPGLSIRMEIETLQNEQLTRSFQSRFQVVLPSAGV